MIARIKAWFDARYTAENYQDDIDRVNRRWLARCDVLNEDASKTASPMDNEGIR